MLGPDVENISRTEGNANKRVSRRFDQLWHPLGVFRSQRGRFFYRRASPTGDNVVPKINNCRFLPKTFLQPRNPCTDRCDFLLWTRETNVHPLTPGCTPARFHVQPLSRNRTRRVKHYRAGEACSPATVILRGTADRKRGSEYIEGNCRRNTEYVCDVVA